MKIDNIKFSEYLVLKDKSKYDYVFKFGKLRPKDVLNLGDLTKQTFEFVKDLQYLYTKENYTWSELFELLAKQTGKTEKQIANLPIFEFKSMLDYLHTEIEKINTAESVKLAHAPTVDEQRANIERFNIYGAFLQYETLSGGDITKIEAIKKLPYEVCFLKLCLDADRVDYEKEIFKIRKNKK